MKRKTDFEDLGLCVHLLYQTGLKYIDVCVFTGLVATPYETPLLRMVGSPPPTHLDPTIYRSEGGASGPIGTGNSNNSLDMLAVAIKIQVDDSVHNLKVRP
jgi:hypothetical protein